MTISPSQTIRAALDALFDAPTPSGEHPVTVFMLCLAQRSGIGSVVPRSKPSAHSWREDGEVVSETGLRDALKGPLRKVFTDLGFDKDRSTGAIFARRNEEGVLQVCLISIRLGDIAAGEYASISSETEEESFKIANGPKPHRYPYKKMANPVGSVIQIAADGTLSTRTDLASGTMEWSYMPVPWDALPGMTKDDIDTDPFIRTLWQNLYVEEPFLRDVRRLGVENGFRDERGNVVE